MIDLRGWKGWTLPLVVAGMNPLAIYVMDSLSKNWVVGQLHIHLPGFLFAKPWGCVVDAALAALLFWLVCYWMYRRKIFLRF
jgi:predicted acyltransferase